MAKITSNYEPFAALNRAKTYRHIRKTHLALLALVFVYAVPSPLYWSIAFVYIFHLTLSSSSSVVDLRCANDDTNSSANARRNTALFGSKRFQQIWFVMKRFSPIHRPKENAIRTKTRKHSVGCEQLVGESTSKLTWSPFVRRRQSDKKRHRLYSSHPDISSTHLNEQEFVQGPKMSDEPSAGSSRWDPSSIITRSPLNRIKKIKRDMQRCVQRVTSTDYDFGNQNGHRGSADKVANQIDEVQLVASRSTAPDAITSATIEDPLGLNEEFVGTPEKRYRFQKAETVDRCSIDNLAGVEFESEIIQVGQQVSCAQGDIALNKVQNYVSEHEGES